MVTGLISVVLIPNGTEHAGSSHPFLQLKYNTKFASHQFFLVMKEEPHLLLGVSVLYRNLRHDYSNWIFYTIMWSEMG